MLGVLPTAKINLLSSVGNTSKQNIIKWAIKLIIWSMSFDHLYYKKMKMKP